MATYNGYKSWQAWNVSLWVNNDEGMYSLARDLMRRNKSKTEAARAMLDMLAESGITKTPDGARYTVSSIRAAMVEM